jgi:hypothetical protein
LIPASFTVQEVNTPTTDPTTIVLLDPTSPDGETSLDALCDDDTNVALVVLLTGRASNALRDFAHSEGTHLSTAAWTYLDRLTPRLHRTHRQLEHVVATGPDTAHELATVAAHRPTGRIVLPASTQRLEPRLAARLAQLVHVPVDVAELASSR